MHPLLRVIVLALATLSSSWAAYQSARWNGVQSQQFNRASAQRAESVRASTHGMQFVQIDVTAFAGWALAEAEGNQRAAHFLRERFRPAFRPAFDAWLASAGQPNEIPKGTPFQRAEYTSAAGDEAERLLETAEVAIKAGQRANQVSDDYMFAIVVFSTVVFLAGLDQPIGAQARHARKVLVALPLVALASALAFMLRLPITIKF